MNKPQWPSRKHPAHGVSVALSAPTIVFLTVCTRDRRPWLANARVHATLVEVWRAADAWHVGGYVLMPDHLHLFCSPCMMDITLSAWVRHWKRAFTLRQIAGGGAWQRDYWDTRLRRHESYSEKWHYVQLNPVRAGLVARPDDWPYRGVLHGLRW